MKWREKIVAALVGLFVLVFVGCLAVDKLLVAPAARLNARSGELRGRINRLSQENRRKSGYLKRMGELAGRTFGRNHLRASEQIRARLVKLLELSGLSSKNLSLKPLVGSRIPGAYKEIGWSIRARGKLEQVVSFLYLLGAEPHLHRLENLTFSPMLQSGEVEFHGRYATLVMEARKSEQLPAGLPAASQPAGKLNGPQHRRYELIAARDLFRPYIKQRKVTPPPRPAVARRSPKPPRQRPAATPTKQFRVVGLPSWPGRQDVFVKDAANGKLHIYTPGESLAGGEIVMVDYRPMPLPDDPEILSGSRAILKIGGEYWAVELGQTLTQKRRLEPVSLPPQLREKLGSASVDVPGDGLNERINNEDRRRY